MRKVMNMNFSSEQEKMLHDISVLSFVVVDLTLYLDTHPNDKEAMEYFNHYNNLYNRLSKEYAKRYEPLTIATIDLDDCNKVWKWGLSPMPWEGGCK